MKQIKKKRSGPDFSWVCVVCRICAADRGTSVHDTIQNAFLTATNVVMVPFIAFLVYKKNGGIQ